MKHTLARLAFTPPVAAIEPDVYPCGPVDLSTNFVDRLSESGSCDPTMEVLMVDSHRTFTSLASGNALVLVFGDASCLLLQKVEMGID